jgi:hypothetical protein
LDSSTSVVVTCFAIVVAVEDEWVSQAASACYKGAGMDFGELHRASFEDWGKEVGNNPVEAVMQIKN